ncbi:lysophospholipid acyltransferase family protein [Geminicoccaceae bacterium 1502E]|nr:lysophospholipid acyltransferase family protein [Geminicoccaceae bacterium 1502E]
MSGAGSVTLRGVVRAAGLLAMTALLLVLRLVLLPFGRPASLVLRRLWCRGCCRLLGIELAVTGRSFDAAPTLLVANHAGYVDILALGAVLDATFIAKAEVARWPVLGLLARQCGTLFIRRDRRHALLQRNELAARMRRGESFVLFAEGTSSSGRTVQRFKSSLLSVLEPWVLDRPVAVQSAAIAYRRHDRAGPDSGHEERYAWWGDATLLPHLWRVLCLPGMRVELRLGEPVLSWDVRDRKQLAARLEDEVRHNLLTAGGEAPARRRAMAFGS